MVKQSNKNSNAQYPMIIVDSKDFVHSAWWEKNSNRYSLKYKRMSSQGKDKYKWQDISLPAISQTNPKSSIFEKEGLLFFKCDLLTIVSKDKGYRCARSGTVEKRTCKKIKLNLLNTPAACTKI